LKASALSAAAKSSTLEKRSVGFTAVARRTASAM
jgi:hypothetical protein